MSYELPLQILPTLKGEVEGLDSFFLPEVTRQQIVARRGIMWHANWGKADGILVAHMPRGKGGVAFYTLISPVGANHWTPNDIIFTANCRHLEPRFRKIANRLKAKKYAPKRPINRNYTGNNNPAPTRN